MTESHPNPTPRYLIRAAVCAVGFYLALAVGAPFILHTAPPSPEAVMVAKLKLCCAAPAGPATTAAPGAVTPTR